MKRILIFESKVHELGHHMEYMHHLYMRALREKNTEFIFAVPKQFAKFINSLSLPNASNISIRILSEQDISFHNSSRLKSIWLGAKKVGELLKETHADMLILIALEKYMPFLPLFIPLKTRILGIVYIIYVYEWFRSSFIKKCYKLFCNFLYAKMPCFKKIFLLNDAIAVVYLNKMWHSTHYAFLPDPYSGDFQLADAANPSSKLTFFHFGRLHERKGTIEILKAMKMLPSDKLKEFRLILAGNVNDKIRKEFFQLVDELKGDLELKIHDDFVSYEVLEEYCAVTDYILIPYKNTDQSSGVITYAAKYSIPVIGPAQGLLGKLIRRHHLGITLKSVNAESLKELFLSDKLTKTKINTNYLQNNSVSNFQEHIFRWIE